MLKGERVLLRPLGRADLPAMWSWYIDPELRQLSSAQPASPVPFEMWEAGALEQRDDRLTFAVEVDGELLGRAVLFDLDFLARSAEVGLLIGSPERRGQGLGLDCLGVLVDYGFRLRNLHRLQVGTLATNAAMRACALRAGFTQEGVRREAAWVDGAYVDEVLFGLLAPPVTPPAQDRPSEPT